MVKNRRRSPISELGEELLVEILCRLALPKYAIRCKSVSKRWYSLINTNSSSYSYFSRRWHQINGKEESKQPVVLLTKLRCYTGQPLDNKLGIFESRLVLDYSSSDDPNTNELPTLNLNFLPCRNKYGDEICILSACKDLLLCCPEHVDHSCYYLCNPFTKQWTALPPPPPLPVEEDEEGACYDTRVGLSVYDEDHSRGSRFAIVRVDSYKAAGIQDVFTLVFSSNGSNGEWRKIGCSDKLHPWEYSCTNVVSYKGDFAWITILYGDNPGLIGFNLNPYPAYTSSVYQPKLLSELFSGYQLELLSELFSGSLGYEYNLSTSLLGVSQGHLRLAKLVDQQKLIVWQWYHGPRQVWEKVQELDFSKLEDSEALSIARACNQPGNRRHMTSLLAFHPHEGDILYLFFSRPICWPKLKYLSYPFSCNLTKKTHVGSRDSSSYQGR